MVISSSPVKSLAVASNQKRRPVDDEPTAAHLNRRRWLVAEWVHLREIVVIAVG
jgi:hypothetical protein